MELTHIPVSLDQTQIHAIQSALAALQIACANTSAHLNATVQAALDAAKAETPTELPLIP